MADENETSWAAEEFAEVSLGDKRLDARLMMLCDRFSDAQRAPSTRHAQIGRRPRQHTVFSRTTTLRSARCC